MQVALCLQFIVQPSELHFLKKGQIWNHPTVYVCSCTAARYLFVTVLINCLPTAIILDYRVFYA